MVRILGVGVKLRPFVALFLRCLAIRSRRGFGSLGVFFGGGYVVVGITVKHFFSVVSFGGFDLCVEGSPYFGHGGCRTF